LERLRICESKHELTLVSLYCFFFQAEDGIRDLIVTGVQTCALPIWARSGSATESPGSPECHWPGSPGDGPGQAAETHPTWRRGCPHARRSPDDSHCRPREYWPRGPRPLR